MRIYVKRMPTEGRHRGSWRWLYVAYGESQPFKRFGHGGWICFHFGWLKRFWNFEKAGCRAECAR